MSIIIPTKNAGTKFGKVLTSIYNQLCPLTFEVIILDSGSIDETLEIARKFPTRILQIDPKDFGHGKTRNLGSRIGSGEYLVFLSQDAIPASERWLQRLISTMHNTTAAGAYGRQIPNEDASPLESFFLTQTYPPTRKEFGVNPDSDELSTSEIFFSNVNSIIRKNVWKEYPFTEDLIMSEDQEWARRVLLSGYTLLYEPKAVVYHSHRYSLKTVFQRYFDSGFSLGLFAAQQYFSVNFLKKGLAYTRNELALLTKCRSFKLIPYAMLYEFCRLLGMFLGKNAKYFPLFLKVRMSLLEANLKC